MRAAALLLALTACDELSREDLDALSDSAADPAAVEDVETIIFHGAAPTAPRHLATVALHAMVGSVADPDPFCSGVLVRTNVVMTAAHCVTTVLSLQLPPSVLGVYVGNDPAVDLRSHLYRVQRVARHPGYDARTLRNDLALIWLTTPIREPVAPVAALPSTLGLTTADVGASLDVVGFGETETGSSGVRLHASVPITGFPTGVSSTQVRYRQSAAGPCDGDSGGPAFLQRGATWYVAGITSYGDSACTSYGVSTVVSAYATWLRANGL